MLRSALSGGSRRWMIVTKGVHGCTSVPFSSYAVPSDIDETVTDEGGNRHRSTLVDTNKPQFATQSGALKDLIRCLLSTQVIVPDSPDEDVVLSSSSTWAVNMTTVKQNPLPEQPDPLPEASTHLHSMVEVQGVHATPDAFLATPKVNTSSTQQSEGEGSVNPSSEQEDFIKSSESKNGFPSTEQLFVEQYSSQPRDQLSGYDATEETRSSDNTSVVETKKRTRRIAHPLVRILADCIRAGNCPTAISVFDNLLTVIQHAKHNGQEPPMPRPDIIINLFRMICTRFPFDAYDVLRFYMTLPKTAKNSFQDGDVNGYVSFFERLTDSIRYLDPQKHCMVDADKLVRLISACIKRMDRKGQEVCCPTLVSALLEQRSVTLGYEFAGPVYAHIHKSGLSVPDGWYIHLLTHSKYHRQFDIPYDHALEKCVELGRRPNPCIVLQVLDNLFPFDDTKIIARMLKSILQMQREVVETAAKENRTPQANEQYYIDVGVLEMIGAGAVSQGCTEINLLIWDMIDALGYKPSIGIYENTIVAFATNTFTYREAFLVLSEMEAVGFVPTRALIRSISTHLRYATGHIDFAWEQLNLLQQEGKVLTVSAINALLSACSEIGKVSRLLSFWSEFQRNGLQPNSDSYSYAFESLGKSIRKSQSKGTSTQHQCEESLAMADSFLSQMEQQGLHPNSHVIREYIELLCIVGQVDTASSVVLQSIQNGNSDLINDKVIYRVATSNAKSGDFEMARTVANCRTDKKPIEFLLQNIDEIEKKATYLLGRKRELQSI